MFIFAVDIRNRRRVLIIGDYAMLCYAMLWLTSTDSRSPNVATLLFASEHENAWSRPADEDVSLAV
jgi:hypothetical protein